MASLDTHPTTIRKHPGGNPSIRTPSNRTTILNHLQRGFSKRMAAAAAGISYQALYEWKADDADMARDVALALEQSAVARFKKLEEKGDEKGDWRKDAWILERRFPEDWGTKVQVQADVVVSNALEGIAPEKILEALRVLSGETVDAESVRDVSDSED